MHLYPRRPVQKWDLSLADRIRSQTLMLLNNYILVIKPNSLLVGNNSSNQINKASNTTCILIQIPCPNSILATRKA